MASPTSRLPSIEALRGIAAVAVVLSHAARHVDKVHPAPVLIQLFQVGHVGVDLFFTISGFIIMHVHRKDINQPSRLRHYLSRRFIRVYPLYWLALAITCAMAAAGGHFPRAADVIWSATLLPTLEEPLLGIAWTLQFEIVFYAVFAVLIASRSAGSVLMAGWLLSIALGCAGVGLGGVPATFHGAFALEFFAGMGAAQALHSRVIPAPQLVWLSGAVLLIVAMTMESTQVFGGFGTLGRFVYMVPCMMVVLGVAAADVDGAAPAPKWLLVPGNASYSIYLFQFVFIGVVWQMARALGWSERTPDALLFVGLAAAAIVGGICISRLVEKPLLRLMRRPQNTAIGFIF